MPGITSYSPYSLQRSRLRISPRIESDLPGARPATVDALLEINNLSALGRLDSNGLEEVPMCIYLFGYDSALEIYRRGRAKLLQARRTEVDLRNASASIKELKLTGWVDWLDHRVHLIAGARRQHRSCAHFETHNWGAHCQFWPALHLRDNLYVSSPEFLFLQMANVLDELSLIFLGCELCGRYSFDQGELTQQEQICSKEHIAQFLSEHAGARGHKRAVKALRYVIDNSGSPMETALVLRLTLPCKKGGRGITPPELNRGIALGRVATMALGRDHITPDLLWQSAKLAVEYEGEAFHTGAERIANDSRRRLALEATGYEVITVTNAQMRNVREFDALAEHIAHVTGKRKVRLSDKTLSRQASLAYDLQRLATDPSLTMGD